MTDPPSYDELLKENEGLKKEIKKLQCPAASDNAEARAGGSIAVIDAQKQAGEAQRETDSTQKSRVLDLLLWGLIICITLLAAVSCIALPRNTMRWLTMGFVVDAAGLGLLLLNRKNHTRLASYLLLFVTFLVGMALSWTAGGIHGPAVRTFPIIVLMAGLLLGKRAGVLVGMVCALYGLCLVWAEHAGLLPPSVVEHTPVSLWLTLCFFIAILILLQDLAVGSINQALQEARQELDYRRKAEEELRKSEAFRKEVFETSRVPIVVMDVATCQYLDCNPAAVEIYRFASREEVLGKTPLDVSAPMQYDNTPSEEKVRQYIEKALADGSIAFEWRHQRPDGVIWDATVRLMSFQSGERQLLQFTLQDITERKQAQEALRESVEFRKRVFDTSCVPIVVMESETFQYVDCNPAAAQIYHFSSREEVLGKTPLDVSAPEQYDGTPSLEKARYCIEKALAEGSVVFEWRHQRSGGEIWDAEVHLMSFQSGRRQFLQFTLQDITARKRAEEALRESEERYRKIANCIPDLVWIMDLSGHYTYANSAVERTHGWTVEEFLQLTYWDVVSARQAAIDAALLEEGLAIASSPHYDRNRSRTFESEDVRKDGSTFWAEVTTAFLWSSDGKPHSLIGISRDITERRRAQEALRESEEKYRTLFENASDAIFLMCEDRFFDCNVRTLELFGCQVRDQIVGRTPYEFSPLLQPDGRDSRAFALEKISAALAGQAQSFEWVHTRLDRTPFSAEVSLNLVELGGKQLLLAIVRDITQRKRAEEKRLRDQAFDEVLTQLLAQFASDDGTGLDDLIRTGLGEIASFMGAEYAFINDVSADRVSWSITHEWFVPQVGSRMARYQNVPAAAIPWAFSRNQAGENIVISKLADLPPGAATDRQLLEEAGIRSMLNVPLLGRGGVFQGSLVLVWLSRKGEWVSEDISRLRLVSDVIANALERKRAEKAHYESERRMRELLETINLLAVMLDRNGNILFCNDCLLKLLGANKEETLGENWFQHIVPEPDQSRFLIEFPKFLANANIPSPIEYPIITSAGKVRQIRWDNTLLRDPDGHVVGAASIGRDLTVELELEKQLRNSQKHEALGILAGGIAHDFNNILGAIIGYAELSKVTLAETEQASAYQNEILTAGTRAKELVQQILTIARQQEQLKTPVEIQLIVKEVLRLLSKVLPSSITIRQQLNPQAGTVMADPAQIHQVLMNLCTNASHAMRGLPQGTLEILLEPCLLEDNQANLLGQLPAGEYVQLQVSDTGHGMDAATLDRIFDPYFTTKKPGEGTGLGLAVVRGIITKHGGAIQVNSEWGKGSIFSVYLPRIGGPRSAENGKVEPFIKGNERILLVDDESQLVQVGRSLLQNLGYKVTAVNSSPEALRIFLASPNDFDLLLTDQTMPDISGVSLAEEVLSVRPDLPVILCTGYTDPIHLQKARQIGIREFLEKPLTRAILSSALRRALDMKKGESS
jgi:PAS domain S-box-containing protein